MKDSSKKKLKELEQKVKDLEQIVEKKQIMIDYLEMNLHQSKPIANPKISGFLFDKE